MYNLQAAYQMTGQKDSKYFVADADHDDVAGYDSDSSLTLAANKSITLSTAISKELRTDAICPRKASKQHHQKPSKMYGYSSSPSCSTDSGGPVHRADSDGSDHSRDALLQPHRRRKYEKSEHHIGNYVLLHIMLNISL